MNVKAICVFLLAATFVFANVTAAVEGPLPTKGRLVNLSARAYIESNVLDFNPLVEDGPSVPIILGFATAAAPGQPYSEKRLLIRAVGGTLANFGVQGILHSGMNGDVTQAGLAMHIYQNNLDLIASPHGMEWCNRVERKVGDKWYWYMDPEGWKTKIFLDLFESSGAFMLQTDPLLWEIAYRFDAPSPTIYSCVTTGAGLNKPRGIALVEVYDPDPTTPEHLINLSCRARINPSEEESIIGGFVIIYGELTVLIRAAGPALLGHGVTDASSDPNVTLYSGQTPLAANDNWEDLTPQSSPPTDTYPLRARINSTKALQSSVGAFAFAEDSTDAAMIVTLRPGVYTFIVKSPRDSVTNLQEVSSALIEVYEMP